MGSIMSEREHQSGGGANKQKTHLKFQYKGEKGEITA